MTLTYTFVPSYKVLEEAEFSFDPQFDIRFDKNKRLLTIKRQDILPENFWGTNISSVTAIVGENGLGKSTLLRYILELVTGGTDRRHANFEGIIISRKENTLFLFLSPTYSDIDIENPDRCSLNKKAFSQIEPIKSILFRGHFYNCFTPVEIWDGQLSGTTNISDGYLLIHSLQPYRNELSDYGVHSLREHLNSFEIENSIMISYFLAAYAKNNIIGNLRLPYYITLYPNRAGEEILSSSNSVRNIDLSIKQQLRFQHSPLEDAKETTLAQFIDTNLKNILVDYKDSSNLTLKIWNQWNSIRKDENDPIKALNASLDLTCNRVERQPYDTLVYFMNQISQRFDFYDLQNGKGGIFYLPLKRSQELNDFLLTAYSNKTYITSRFFDARYAIELTTLTNLSSGEEQLLKLLSRLYFNFIIKPLKIDNAEIPSLIILDEAETSFHPDWQRNYINTILSFLTSLSDIGYRKPLPKFQLIYTTHSPISLSDMPGCCVNFIKRGSSGKSAFSVGGRFGNGKETFGANVFDLYRDSFFLRGGMVGSFATRKIREIADIFNNRPDNNMRNSLSSEDIGKTIDIIGDPRIREYLLQLLEKEKEQNRESDEVMRLKEEIKKLKKENQDLKGRESKHD